MKLTKFAIAVVLVDPTDQTKVLAVKRPPDDDSLPNVWGLPAVTVMDGELPEQAVERVGREKLFTKIRPVSYIGVMRAEREKYELILMDIRAALEGPPPSVIDAPTRGTKYVDQRWTNDYEIFIEAASKGSLCSRVFLQSQGLSWE